VPVLTFIRHRNPLWLHPGYSPPAAQLDGTLSYKQLPAWQLFDDVWKAELHAWLIGPRAFACTEMRANDAYGPQPVQTANYTLLRRTPCPDATNALSPLDGARRFRAGNASHYNGRD